MKKKPGGRPRKPWMTAIHVRIHKNELRALEVACANLGIKKATYVRLALAENLSLDGKKRFKLFIHGSRMAIIK